MTRTVDLDGLDALLSKGATLVDVLPEGTYADEHIPGARNVPLTKLDEHTVRDLDRSSAVVVYCFDYQCDLSPRAAAVLRCLGFRDVADFAPGRAAWTSDGRPTAGTVGDRDRILPRVQRDVPRCRPDDNVGDARSVVGEWELCVVTDEAGTLLGMVRADALDQPAALPLRDVLVPGPGTVRPDGRVTELAEQLDRDNLEHVLVTTHSGKLLGLLRRSDLDGDR